MKVIYRLSGFTNKKKRPEWFSKENCLDNAIATFGAENMIMVANQVSREVLRPYRIMPIVYIEAKDSSESFNAALDVAIETTDNNETIYLLEDDYIHRPGSLEKIEEGLTMADYVTLYHHPGSRIIRDMENGWTQVESTTSTVACKRNTLIDDEKIFRIFSDGKHKNWDFWTYYRLNIAGRVLITPVPSFSTHCETEHLAPGINWEEYRA